MAVNSGYAMYDHIDRLTDHYRVLLFEPSSARELVDALTDARERRGVSAELMLVLGHGTQESIVLNADPHDQARKNLYADDPALQRLSGLMKPRAAIALLSCSTAADTEFGAKSIFETFRRVFPSCYLFGPKGATLTPEMSLGPSGEFRSMQYADTRTVFYNPLTQKVSETRGTPFYLQMAKMYFAQTIKHPLAPYISAILALAGALASFRTGRRVVRAALEAGRTPSSAQSSVQPPSSWLGRFVIALWRPALRTPPQPHAGTPSGPAGPIESQAPVGQDSSREGNIPPFTIQSAGNSGPTIDVFNGSGLKGLTISIRNPSEQPAQPPPGESGAAPLQSVETESNSLLGERMSPLLDATFGTSRRGCADSL